MAPGCLKRKGKCVILQNMKRRTIFSRLAGLLLLVSFMWLAPKAAVTAQNTASLAINPAQINVPLGNQVLLKVTVMGGVNVNAFDIKLIYDQDRLSLASWAHGDYLSALFCMQEVKTPGVLELLGCTQLNQPAVSGDGILLELVFNTRALGTVDINITEAAFADPSGVQSAPQRQNGVVNIQNLPTFTNTPATTLTPSITYTTAPLTATPTPSQPTATMTVSPLPSQTFTATLPANVTPSPSMPPTFTATNTPISGVIGPTTPDPSGTAIFPRATDTPGGYPPGMPTGKATDATGQPTQIGSLAGQTETPERDMPTQPDGTNESPARRAAKQVLNYLLWGGLVISLVILVLMVIVVIQRRKHKDEDLLL